MTAFEHRTLTPGTGDVLAAQARAMNVTSSSIDEDSARTFLLLGGGFSIAALVRDGEAHEYLATQEARARQLFQLSTAQQARITSAEASATRLEHIADQLGGRNATLEERLRGNAQTIRDGIQTLRDGMTQELQTHFDELAGNERKAAIRSYALAIHLARLSNIPTVYSSRAMDHIRSAANRPLIDEALRAMPPGLVAATRFVYTPGMFDADASQAP